MYDTKNSPHNYWSIFIQTYTDRKSLETATETNILGVSLFISIPSADKNSNYIDGDLFLVLSTPILQLGLTLSRFNPST